MGSGRAKMRRILEWRIWSRWVEINTRDFCEPSQWGQKKPKEANRYSDQAKSNIRSRVKSWNYFSASSTTRP